MVDVTLSSCCFAKSMLAPSMLTLKRLTKSSLAKLMLLPLVFSFPLFLGIGSVLAFLRALESASGGGRGTWIGFKASYAKRAFSALSKSEGGGRKEEGNVGGS